jgi:hypothetical protein
VIGLLKFFLECYGLDVSAYPPNAEEGHRREARRRIVKCIAIDRRMDLMHKFIRRGSAISQKAELKFVVFLYFGSLRVKESGHPCGTKRCTE